MDCRAISARNFRTRLGFKLYNVILTKEQWMLTIKMSSFVGENMRTQYYVLGYTINLYFHEKKVAMEIDENEHSDRSIDYEIKNQKVVEEKVGCKFIRTDLDKGNFDVLRAINEKFRHIKQSAKKTPINKLQQDY